MRIGYLGIGAWGFCLAQLLAKNGHDLIMWSSNHALLQQLQQGQDHPQFPGHRALPHMQFTTHIKDAATDVDLLVESVTAEGLRPVFTRLANTKIPACPIVLTSKGIEQHTGLLPSEVAIEVLGENHMHQIGCLSGPSIAKYVMQEQPTSVVCSAYSSYSIQCIREAFHSPYFRVYPNTDVYGTSFGGAMKNIIAIACGISDGLGFGENSKAALITRGLHEIRKLSQVKQCNPDTLNGLSGLGDLCVTCMSPHSRNYRFGKLIAEGLSMEEAKAQINMVVEGAYTALSAVEMAKSAQIDMPIIEATYRILYEGVSPLDAVKILMEREIQDELL